MFTNVLTRYQCFWCAEYIEVGEVMDLEHHEFPDGLVLDDVPICQECIDGDIDDELDSEI